MVLRLEVRSFREAEHEDVRKHVKEIVLLAWLWKMSTKIIRGSEHLLCVRTGWESWGSAWRRAGCGRS